MSVHISSMVWKLRGVTPSQRLVLLALADTADDDGECWPSLKRIAEKSGVSKRMVMIHVQTSVLAGLLTSTPRKRDDGSQTSNLYAFNPAALAAAHEHAQPPTETCPPPDNNMSPGVHPTSPRGALATAGGGEAQCTPILDPVMEPSWNHEDSSVVPEAVTPEPAVEDRMFTFEADLLAGSKGRPFHVTKRMHATWVAAYPAVDVKVEYPRMVAWMMSKARGKKTPRGMSAFINSWLGRQQDTHPQTLPPLKPKQPSWDHPIVDVYDPNDRPRPGHLGTLLKDVK